MKKFSLSRTRPKFFQRLHACAVYASSTSIAAVRDER